MMRQIPGIARRWRKDVPRRSAVRKLPCGVLAEENTAARLEARRDRGVARRHMLRQKARLTGRPDASRLDNVFQAIRDALHWPPIDSGHEIGLSLARVVQRALGLYQNDGTQFPALGANRLKPAF